MNTSQVLYKIKGIDDLILELDKDTGSHLQLAKAFFLKGVTSVLDDGMLVEALSHINLDTYALYACVNFDNMTLINIRNAGKMYAEKYKLTL